MQVHKYKKPGKSKQQAFRDYLRHKTWTKPGCLQTQLIPNRVSKHYNGSQPNPKIKSAGHKLQRKLLRFRKKHGLT